MRDTKGLQTVSCLPPLQKAIQDKFNQVCTNLEELTSWLDQVEGEVSGLSNLSENAEKLDSQITIIKVGIQLR